MHLASKNYLNVFKHQTTYNEDYQKFLVVKKTSYDYSRENCDQFKDKLPPVPNYTDNESYYPWKSNVQIPFNLFHLPKAVIGENPSDPYPDIEPVPLDNEEAIKARPRIYMLPACGIDNIEDKEMRQSLCQFIYSSDWKKAEKEAASVCKKRTIPKQTIERAADCVRLQLDTNQSIAEHKRKLGKQLEHEQRRAEIDSTREFWLNYKGFDTSTDLDSLVPQPTKDEIRRLLIADKLRLAHDKAPPTYAGYEPSQISEAVTLEKNDLPLVHPFISVTQAITNRFKIH